MEIIGVIGFLIALAVLIVAVFKGYHVIPVVLIASLIAIVTNGADIWEVLSQGFNASMMNFVGNYLIMFFLGALLGELIGKSGAARSIGSKMASIFGAKRAFLIVVVTSAILSYGGISVFVIVFSIYPIALFLFKEADIPKRLIVGAIMLGAGSFTMTAMPGSPALTNIIPTSYLGTTATAAPIMGGIVSVVMFATGMAIFTVYEKRIVAKGERFVAGPDDEILELTPEEIAKLPSFGKAIIPILVTVGIILGERFLAIGLASVYTVNIGLTAGCLSAYLLFWDKLRDVKSSFANGANGSVSALMNTASVVGFGGTIQMLPAFQSFIGFATSITLHPYITIFLAVTIIAGVTGSSSAGITIFMESMAQQFLDMGVNPQILHRISSIGAGVLDSLPHAGPNVTMLAVTGLTFKEGYPGIFISTVIVPLTGIITAIILAFLGIV